MSSKKLENYPRQTLHMTCDGRRTPGTPNPDTSKSGSLSLIIRTTACWKTDYIMYESQREISSPDEQTSVFASPL